MNDRELLELAAKAAGYEVRWHENWQCFVHEGPHNTDTPATLAGQRLVWVPLTDDGDALRLAVKLKMEVCVWDRDTTVLTPNDDISTLSEPANGDPLAATRRAITRAAAEIGRATP